MSLRKVPWLCPAPLLLIVCLGVSAHEGQIRAKVSRTVLDNGLTLVVKEDHAAPIFCFQIWYKVGSRNERPGITGISHMTEHMMFKGTPSHPTGDYWKITRRHGGNARTVNGFTGDDMTAYYMVFAKDKLDIPLELESDRMANCLMSADDWAREREVIKEERRYRIDDQPWGSLYEHVIATAFMAHSYQWSVIGWMSDIEATTADQIREYYRTYYVPNNAVVVVVGDVDADQVIEKVTRYFGPIPRGPEIPPVASAEPEQRGERRVVLNKPGEHPILHIAYHTPTMEHPDFYPLTILQNVLLTGNSSRLYRRAVYEEELALNVWGRYSGDQIDPGLLYISVDLRPDVSTEEAEKVLYAEIERLQSEGISQRELDRAKNQIVAKHIFDQERVLGQARKQGQLECLGQPRFLESFVGRIRSVTDQEVQEVAQRYLTERNRTVGVLVPEESAAY